MGRKLDPKIVPYDRVDGIRSYRVRVRANGKQTTETFDTLTAAETFVRRVKDPAIGADRAVEMRDREDTNSSGYVPTLREMLARHVEDLTGVEPETRAEYLRLSGRTWLPMLGSYRVDELARADIARWVNSATGAPKTVRNAHSVLSATLQAALIEGHITGNPARGTRLPRAGEEHVEDIHFLTHAEFDRLYPEFPEDQRAIVVWMFGMGTRWGETTAQQPRDIDRAAGQWVDDVWTSTPLTKIVRAWKRKPRRVGPPKSKASRRTVLMPGEVLDAVTPLLDGRPGDAWLFPTATGKAITHGNFFNRVWKPATMRASVCVVHRLDRCRCFGSKPYLCPIHTEKGPDGIRILPGPCGCAGTLPFRPRIHDARHTHASWLIAQGVALEVVQERLGHEDYLTTRRLYAHLMPDAQLRASAAASVAFASTILGATRPRLELD